MNVRLQGCRALKLILIFLITPICGNLFSQEYKYDIGGSVGMSSYMGDANRSKTFIDNPGMTVGALIRYNVNPQWAVKTTLLAGSVSGNSHYSGNKFPGGQHRSFNRNFVDIGSQIEFNFFRYGTEKGYLNVKHYTPYLFAGAGVTLSKGDEFFLGANMPLGVGFKYKIKNRLNIGVEVSNRKLFRDDFDVVKRDEEWNLDAPYGIESSHLKNQDRYTMTLIYLTWDFGLLQSNCR